jgi:hypothetical protein
VAARMTIALIGLLTAVELAGCGGPKFPTARLEGTVTVDGVPVEKGNISFTPIQGGRLSATAAITGGRYVAEGVPQGKVRVDFQGTKETGKTVMQFDKPYPETVDVIPQKYRTGMEIEVGGSDANRDFKLTSK